MNAWFARLSIRRKLLVFTVAVATSTVFIAALAAGAYQFSEARSDLTRTVAHSADLVAENSAAAITFDNPKDAGSVLQSLRAEPNVILACLYKDTKLFATYAARTAGTCPATPAMDGIVFSEGSLNLNRPVLLEGQRIGTISISSTLEAIYAKIWRDVGFLTAMLLISTLFAYVLSAILQGYLSGPILKVAATAQTISEQRNYALRARVESGDELTILVNSFNEMLSQIQLRDDELSQAKALLERRVEERTAELARRNEELDSRNRDLDDFAYIASHDLKEPLRGIHNYASFLLEDYEDKLETEGRDQLQTLVRLSKLMERIIDSLLEYSRVGRSELSVHEVDLDQVLKEVLETLAITLSERNVDVRIPKPLPVIACDRVRVAEVFRNLISNAAKYNEKPDKWIEVGEMCRGGMRVFYVRDNGIGIPEKHKDAVFQIFKRLHARDKYGGGTGAGLTIVKKIVERHDGKIWLESLVSEGTTFYFTLSGGSID